jgi:hypothetical protein
MSALPPPPPALPPPPPRGGWKGWQIALLVVGIVLGVALLLFGACLVLLGGLG